MCNLFFLLLFDFYLEKKTLKPGKTLTGIDSFKMGSAEEIVETLKNRRQTKMIYSKHSFIAKNSLKIVFII